ncbi:MAG: glycosyltransferase family 39 protein [Candidatus Omnitrophica bacterium]|nr:glycosyltransferase family 39 protein [Candidatus Omnitrophota bacterium]
MHLGVIKKYKYALLLTALILFHAVNNYIWLRQDNESLGYDVIHHANITFSIRQDLLKIFLSGESPAEKLKSFIFLFTHVTQGSLVWPRLFHFIAALMSSFVSHQEDVFFWIRFSNILYFAILIVSIYLLGKKILSPAGGFLAAFFISLYPGVFGLSRKYGLDFPLIAIVSLAIYFLLSCDGFKKRSYSLFFGIASGLGMLIKCQFALFIIGPFLYTVFQEFISRQNKRNIFLNISIFITLFLAISLVWWHNILSSVSRISLPGDISLEKGRISYSLIYYLGVFYYNISPLLFAMFILGLAYLKNLKKLGLFFLLWFLVPYLFFSLFVLYNHERYVFPVFGAVALISANGLLRISNKRIKTALIFFFVFMGFIQFFKLSYNYCWSPFFASSWIVHPPQKRNHRLIMTEFNQIIQSDSSPEKSIAIIEERYFRGDSCLLLSYYLKLLNDKNDISLSADGVICPRSQVSGESLSKVNNSEFVIAFSRSPTEPDLSGLLRFSDASTRAAAQDALRQLRKYRILKRSVLSPNGIDIFLLKKEKPAP